LLALVWFIKKFWGCARGSLSREQEREVEEIAEIEAQKAAANGNGAESVSAHDGRNSRSAGVLTRDVHQREARVVLWTNRRSAAGVRKTIRYLGPRGSTTMTKNEAASKVRDAYAELFWLDHTENTNGVHIEGLSAMVRNLRPVQPKVPPGNTDLCEAGRLAAANFPEGCLEAFASALTTVESLVLEDKFKSIVVHAKRLEKADSERLLGALKTFQCLSQFEYLTVPLP
jgi:hypothetical protein